MSEQVLLQPGESIRPQITLEGGKVLVEKLYGLKCDHISELNGYDDKNYKIVASELIRNVHIERVCEDGYVLKVMNSLDSRKIKFVDAQNSLMIYLNNSGICCPKPVQNQNGKYYSLETLESGKHIVRLLEFIKGKILLDVPKSPSLCHQIGEYVANFDLLLKNFHHTAYETHQTLWMLDSVPQLKQFIYVIHDDCKRKVVQEVIKEFEDRVLQASGKLEKGIIHGDFNEQNILVNQVNGEWIVTSVLDFGDTHFSCYVFELAITMAYLMILGKDLDTGGHVIAGYMQLRDISELEFSLLKVCIAARLCQSLVLGAYTSSQDPGNSSYLLTTASAGWSLLMALWQEDETKLLLRWKSIANSYIKAN